MKKPPKIRYRDLLNRPPTPARGSDALAPVPELEVAEPAPVLEAAAEALPVVVAEEPPPDVPVTVVAEEPPAGPALAPVASVDEEYLVFRVGQELFALPLDAVEEAIDIDQVQPIPEMSATMLGVLTLRGALVPVYAPSVALGVAADTRAAALIFVTPRGLVALAVDDVDDVMLIPPGELHRAPLDFGDGVLVGVARRGGDLIGVLDATALMAACRVETVLETA